MQSVNNDLTKQKNEQVALLKKLDSVDSKRASKQAAGELDATTDSVMHAYITRLRDSIQNRIQQYDALLAASSRKKRKLRKAHEYFNYVSTLYKSDLANVLFFDELLAANTFTKLNTAVFFGPGEYRVADPKAAEKLLNEVTRKVLDFSEKHSDRTLYASFIVLGYADQQDYVPGSDLYKDLTSNATTSSPSRIQLNVEMSNRRANAITSILRNQYRLLRSNYQNSKIVPSFFSIGKGEQLPAGNITDYKAIDERRRVVLIYWSVLPKLND